MINPRTSRRFPGEADCRVTASGTAAQELRGRRPERSHWPPASPPAAPEAAVPSLVTVRTHNGSCEWPSVGQTSVAPTSLTRRLVAEA